MSVKMRNKTFTNSDNEEVELKFSTMPARKAFLLKIELMKYVLPTLGAAAKNLGGLMKAVKKTKGEKLDIMNMDTDNLNIDFSLIVNTLSEKMEGNALLTLILKLFKGSMVNNIEIEEESFDDIFNADFGTMYKMLAFILEANYGSLFSKSDIGTPSIAL